MEALRVGSTNSLLLHMHTAHNPSSSCSSEGQLCSLWLMACMGQSRPLLAPVGVCIQRDQLVGSSCRGTSQKTGLNSDTHRSQPSPSQAEINSH